MSRFALHAANVVLPDVVRECWVIVEDGVIQGASPDAPADAELVDFGDAWIAPGFVDTHIHGFAGFDVMDCDAQAVVEISRAIAKGGTTSWLPTTLTASPEQTGEACAAVAEAARLQKGQACARIQGIFLEGPFFSEKYKGAQNPAYLIDPSLELLDSWQKAAAGLIRKSALAPEREGAGAYIAGCTERGVVAAIGHSDASYEQAREAVVAGATVFVHTYNAMRPLTHREPGVVGAAMTSDEAVSEIICDGLHVSPPAVDALVRAKGWDHVMLITDSLRCGGMPDGEYVLGELPIRLEGGVARLIDGGNIAGSVLTMAAAVKNIVSWGVVGPECAIRMASEVPARAHGLARSCGTIGSGMSADLCVLSPAMDLLQVYAGGEELL